MVHSERKGEIPESEVPAEPAKPALNKFILYGCLAAVLLFVSIVRYRLLHLPLERDEGEYALMGQLILKGIPPYELAYNMKLPGTYYLYALMMSVFGQSTTGIHLGLLMVNLACILLLFFIGKKLLNETTALYAAAAFALLSLSPGSLGFAAHATHFNVLFALCGLLALLHYADRASWRRLTLSGVCFGLSFVMKQQAVFMVLFGLLAFWLIERKRTATGSKNTTPRLGAFAGALALPYLLILLTAWFSGTFDKFWHWTVSYAGQYAGMKTWSEAWGFLQLYFPHISEGYLLFWLTGLLGLAALFYSENARRYRWIILLFAACSLACVVPGLYFRPHYFIIFLPALALLSSVALNFFGELMSKRQLPWLKALPVLLFAVMLYAAISTHWATFFKDDLGKICTATYGPANPFQESVEIAKFIRANTTEQDKIAVLGSEPQIYFYSNRLPATGYIYTYPLMENQSYSWEMQSEMTTEIEKNRPKFLVFVNSPVSWTFSNRSSKGVFDWYQQYQKNYNIVGLVDMNPSGKATYLWREAMNGYAPKNKNQIWVHERK